MPDCIKSFTEVQGDDYYKWISRQEISDVMKKVYESSGSGASWPESKLICKGEVLRRVKKRGVDELPALASPLAEKE